eukprot:CAMPEP_0174763190 /NCGR_PEP_ID=MMETSP1094-20130205/110156_1 /TAXON_ID=156173 /ORGANISM="Chrysochromulina brevifilum, Strain UTEX LB 985" /LENGTH=38 /DNA_ID= /DNA_START= /DNA_END= /DNA_ORIENTATION=
MRLEMPNYLEVIESLATREGGMYDTTRDVRRDPRIRQK